MTITIYSTKACPYCKMEKEYLDSRGVTYANIFIDEDEKKADEVIKLSGQMGVPVTVATDDAGKQSVVVGFDRPKLNALLGLR